MSRTHDLVYIFNGGSPFSTRFNLLECDFNLQPYLDRLAKLKYSRTHWEESRGVDADVDANIDTIMADIKSFTNNRFDTIGQACILGRSAGCALALGLAAELNKRGVNELTFVGVSDVSMWDVGRKPPVRGVGNFRPQNNPVSSGAEAPNRFLGGVNPVSVVPFLKLDAEIKVKTGNKINHYQVQGNHMKYAWKAGRWMWWSDLSEGEVHGRLDGFENVASAAFGKDDLARHVDLNLGEQWKRMSRDAAAAFADLPDQPMP